MLYGWREEPEPKEVDVTVEVTIHVAKTIKLSMYEGYTKGDVYNEIDDIVKKMVLTDNENRECDIEDYEILEYYD